MTIIITLTEKGVKMTIVSNIAIGAHLAGNAAAKARHGSN